MLALLLLLAACGMQGADGPTSTPDPAPPDAGEQAEPEPEAPEPERDVDPEPEIDPGPQHAEAPDHPEPYEPVEGEMRPNAKRTAARIVEALTTYEIDDAPADVVASLAEGALADDLLEDAAPVLHEDAWSRGRVAYPQLGGMTEDETAVMVVVEQSVGLDDGTVLDEARTMDVRLRLHQGEWVLGELASAGGEPVERPDDLSEPAAAVLDDERITLPDTARWDIHSGATDDDLLRLMARMADHTPYEVNVLDTGHPWEVFGTERQSKHTMGQAVDVHALGDDATLVIEDRQAGSATHELVRWIYEQPELSEVGSPWALDGFGGSSFSDPLHQDHIHVGVGGR